MKGSLKSFIHWKQEITLSTQDEIYGTWDKPGLLYTFSSHFVLFSSSTNYDKIVFIKKDLIDISKKRKWMIYSVYPKNDPCTGKNVWRFWMKDFLITTYVHNNTKLFSTFCLVDRYDVYYS